MSRNTPLQAKIEKNELVMRIGIGVLAFAFEHQDSNNPYVIVSKDECGEVYDWIQQFQVTDKKEFANDVIRAMFDEEEDGSTPLTRFLDKMGEEAVNQGSIGIDQTRTARELEKAGFNTLI